MADSVNSTALPDGPPPLIPDQLSDQGGEPRIIHLVVAERLGTRQQEVARLIERNRIELEGYGEICVAATQNTDPQGRGRPGKAYHLNEGQALVICALSRTPQAASVRRQVVDVFMAYRRGKLGPLNPKAAPAVAPAVAQEAQSILRFIETAGRDSPPARPALAAPPAFPVTRETTLLRFPEVHRRTGYTRTWVFRLERQGKFPKRVKLGPKSVGWIEEEVTAWIAGRQAGRDGEGMPWLLTPPGGQAPPLAAPPPPIKPERVRAPTPTPRAQKPEVPEERPPLAADLLNGPEKIAAFLGMTASQVQTLASRHQFPAFWVGTQLLARKSTLTRWFADAEAAAFRAMTDVAELERLEDAP